MSYQDLVQERFTKMIDAFREEFEKLSDKEKTREQQINTLRFPCQFHIISSPDSLKHVIFKTNFTEIKDKSVNMIQLKNDTFVEQLEEFLKDPAWSEPAEEGFFGNSRTLRDKLEGDLIRFTKMMNNDLPKQLSKSGIFTMMLDDEKLASWTAYGRLDELDLISKSRSFVEEYKRNYEVEQKAPEKEKSPKAVEEKSQQITKSMPDHELGFGTFFYPPLLIGDLQPTFADKLRGRKYERLQDIVVETKFDGHLLYVTKGGLIGIESKENELAEKVLNTIMAISLVSGIHCYAVRRTELAELGFNKTTHKITSTSWSYSSLRMELFDLGYQYGSENNWKTDIRHRIGIKDIETIIKKAEEIWENKDQYHFLKLLLGSFTHLDAGEYSQSFIMSWNVLERYLFELWRKKLYNARVTRRIREDLDRWDVYRVLEILHLDKEITEDNYQQFKQLQKLRNDVIHEGYEITETQAKSCYDLAYDKIIQEIGISEKIKITKNVMV